MLQKPGWDREKLYDSGDPFFDSVIDGLRRAQNSIELEFYIFIDDHLGRTITEELQAAAQRGVNVRVLVDGIGSPSWGMRMAGRLEAHGVHTKIYHPLPWHFWQFSRSAIQRSFFAKLFHFWAKLNRRDHRKLVIVDDCEAWVGSMNITDVHLSQERGGRDWRDTGVHVEGAPVQTLKKLFEASWRPRLKIGLNQFALANSPVRSNETIKKRRFFYSHLLRKIRRSRDRVWITNAYFVPDMRLIRALRRAAKRGVDVRVIVPACSDHFFIPWATYTFYTQLIQMGVRVFEYQTRVLHAKTIIVDTWALVGTSNLNHRSLLHDLELDIVVSHQDTLSQIGEDFLRDQQHSIEILSEHIGKRSFFIRILGRIVMGLKKWI